MVEDLKNTYIIIYDNYYLVIIGIASEMIFDQSTIILFVLFVLRICLYI